MGNSHDDSSEIRDWQIIGQMATGLFDQVKKNRDEADVKTYSQEFGKDPNFRPDYNDPGFNPKAFSLARAEHINQLTQDENIKKARHETWKQDIDKKMVLAHETFAKALSLFDEDNPDEALPYVEKAFEFVNTNSDIKFGADKKSYIEVNNLTGEETPHNFKSTRDMFSKFQNYALGLKDPKVFAANHVMSSDEATKHNIAAISAATEVFDKSGNRALLVKNMVDVDTGKPLGDMIDLGNENYIPANSDEGRAFRSLKSTGDELKNQETKAGIGLKEAERFKTIQEGLKESRTSPEDKNLSPEDKLARGLARDHGVSKQAADEYVMAMKENNPKLRIITDALKEDSDLTLSSPSIQQKIKEAGLEDYFSSASLGDHLKKIDEKYKKGKGKGIQADPKAPKPQPLSKDEQAGIKKMMADLKAQGKGKTEAIKIILEKNPNLKGRI
jgi:hypothetical protein